MPGIIFKDQRGVCVSDSNHGCHMAPHARGLLFPLQKFEDANVLLQYFFSRLQKRTCSKITGRCLPAPAKTHDKIASWGDLGAWKVFIGSFWISISEVYTCCSQGVGARFSDFRPLPIEKSVFTTSSQFFDNFRAAVIKSPASAASPGI